MFQKLSVLRKLYNITVYTYSLASYIREFKSLIRRRIPLNNYTRQNSWYFILSIAIQKEFAINIYIKHNLNCEGTLQTGGYKDTIMEQDRLVRETNP